MLLCFFSFGTSIVELEIRKWLQIRQNIAPILDNNFSWLAISWFSWSLKSSDKGIVARPNFRTRSMMRMYDLRRSTFLLPQNPEDPAPREAVWPGRSCAPLRAADLRGSFHRGTLLDGWGHPRPKVSKIRQGWGISIAMQLLRGLFKHDETNLLTFAQEHFRNTWATLPNTCLALFCIYVNIRKPNRELVTSLFRKGLPWMHEQGRKGTV